MQIVVVVGQYQGEGQEVDRRGMMKHLLVEVAVW
jgi:hypothetical protein